MNIERFKIDFKRAVEALLPWALAHKMPRSLPLMPVGPDSKFDFPPFFMIFTIEIENGTEFPMVSVSAPLRPTKILDQAEREATKEAFKEIFPGYEVMAIRNFTAFSAAFKLVALPVDSPSKLRERYQELEMK